MQTGFLWFFIICSTSDKKFIKLNLRMISNKFLELTFLRHMIKEIRILYLNKVCLMVIQYYDAFYLLLDIIEYQCSFITHQ